MTALTTRHRGWRLSTQVLFVLLGILLIAAVADAILSYRDARADIDKQAGDKSLAVARMVATDPVVTGAFGTPDPARMIEPIAERIRRAAGAAFVVVANRQGIRYSHPDPALIGTSLLHDPGENPGPVLAGGTYVGVQRGSLGRSMRAKVPIRDSAGHVIGLVSVGILEQRVSTELSSRLLSTLVPSLLALGLGVAGAVLLARRVKRQTFGMEPAEIAALLEQREAMLHGVREGTITLDTADRITLVNEQAERLLGLDRATAVGRPIAGVVPAGRVRDVLTGRVSGRDEIILLGRRVLVVNHMPVEVRGRPVGAVITLRDRTELEDLLRELD
ncbi:MAG: PAS domain-containing protein, partial [Mycobacterium sp.]